MNSLKTLSLSVLSLFVLIMTGCDDSSTGGVTPVDAQRVTDLPANVNTIFSPAAPDSDIPGDTESNPGYTYYDLDRGMIVDDSLSSEWDIAFGSTTILANSAANGGIQLLNTAYADVNEAPAEGYTGENNSWYTYVSSLFAVFPNEDETLVVLTPDGNYAKVQILSYYEGNPDTESAEFANPATRPAARHFTFNYTLQRDGSRELFHEDSFTYYDLDAMEVVEDSLSSAWDIAFNATTIIANSENGGGIQGLNIPFADVDEAPESGYVAENRSWYTYTGQAPSGPQMAVLPKEGYTIAIQTPDERYAKVRILNYYEGNPDLGSQEFANIATRPASRYYTFDFALQTDGSRFFE